MFYEATNVIIIKDEPVVPSLCKFHPSLMRLAECCSLLQVDWLPSMLWQLAPDATIGRLTIDAPRRTQSEVLMIDTKNNLQLNGQLNGRWMRRLIYSATTKWTAR